MTRELNLKAALWQTLLTGFVILATASAYACPQLAGKYSCQVATMVSPAEVFDLEINQSKGERPTFNFKKISGEGSTRTSSVKAFAEETVSQRIDENGRLIEERKRASCGGANDHLIISKSTLVDKKSLFKAETTLAFRGPSLMIEEISSNKFGESEPQGPFTETILCKKK